MAANGLIYIKNAHIITVTGAEYANGSVLIGGGKIISVGENIAVPADAEVFDAGGKYLIPGLIDAHTHVGICEEIYNSYGEDTNEMTDPITPHLRALDAINHEDLGFADALRGGVTTVAIAPGSANVLCGEIAVLKTAGGSVDEMLLKEPAAMKAAFGENPKGVYGTEKKTPMTRMATAALMREALIKAGNYERGESKDRDLKMEALVGVLNGRLPLHAHAHRADDMLTAMRIAREFGLKLVLVHGTDGHKIAPLLADNDIQVVSGPLFTSRAKVEMKDVSFESPGIMSAHGVKVSLCTDHPVIPINYLLLCAALAHRAGMNAADALAAVTINPAVLLGVDNRIGSIAEGKDADLVIIDGYPLSTEAKVEKVMMSGIWRF